MKAMKWVGGIAAVLIVAILVAYIFRKPLVMRVPALVQDLTNPIGPNVPVEWQRGPEVASPGKRPPNIIVIMTDDVGFNDVGFNGGAKPTTDTPHIDTLAAEGIRFPRAYAGNAVCAPSRAAIMTGRYPTRFGFEFTPAPAALPRIAKLLQDPESGRRQPIFHAPTDAEIPAYENMGVPASEITIAELLRDRGYHTLHIGKWHLGSRGGMTPHQQGFAESLNMQGLAYLPEDDPNVVNSKQEFDFIDKFLWSNMRYAVNYNDGKPFAPKGYLTDYYTQEAVRAIEHNRNRPFFLYLAHWGAHTPLQALKSDYDALDSIESHRKRVYAAMIRAVDRGVGEVLQALKDNGIDDNTLVIFTSDNGGANYIAVPDINDPFRGWKLTQFEGGLRIPFAMRWPDKLPAGGTYEHRISHMDVFATVAAVAGAEVPSDRKMDGVNLLPYVRGQAKGSPHEALFWKQGHYQTVIAGDWKLQRSERPNKIWLYDLANDPTEQVNLADKRPDKRDELIQRLDAYLAELPPPLWPSSVEAPTSIDKLLNEPESPDDEYIYFPN